MEINTSHVVTPGSASWALIRRVRWDVSAGFGEMKHNGSKYARVRYCGMPHRGSAWKRRGSHLPQRVSQEGWNRGWSIRTRHRESCWVSRLASRSGAPSSDNRHSWMVGLERMGEGPSWEARVDIEIYDGAGHAFENHSNRRGYRPKAAAIAWFETLKFFEQETVSTSPVS